ncbi:unnamed protein product [Notodromas monacha]|uniref:Phospholipase n=1 Tax=Notodromas monacha TaxID=399045 RepID=A0A7R9BD49_9CRUS|nr:unnamed protein product [Notodromas monacha]CAG0913114.1 unnamed protein product [Notodromas monacha]
MLSSMISEFRSDSNKKLESSVLLQVSSFFKKSTKNKSSTKSPADTEKELPDDGGSSRGSQSNAYYTPFLKFTHKGPAKDTDVLPFRFTILQNPPVPFKKRRAMLPHAKFDIKVRFRRHLEHGPDPYEYEVFVTHGPFSWCVFREYEHFGEIEDSLIANAIWRRIASGKSSVSKFTPVFPYPPDSDVPPESAKRRAHEFEIYLNDVLAADDSFDQDTILDFLGLSIISLVTDMGDKLYEGYVQLRDYQVVGTKPLVEYVTSLTCSEFFFKRMRWLAIKDSFLAVYKPQTGKLCFVILVDQQYQVEPDKDKKGGMVIGNKSIKLRIGFRSQNWFENWYAELATLPILPGARDYARYHRFGSSYPERPKSYGAWYVDGATFMESVANAIEDAREEIFITDWWLTPEVFLKRRSKKAKREEHFNPDYWRLDFTLQRAADRIIAQDLQHRGVKIFILLYQEIERAVDLGSKRTANLLKGLHKNVHIIRHPQRLYRKTLTLRHHVTWLWSNHEKIIAIDQNYAFIGGLDLCYGRWDTREHSFIGENVVLPTRLADYAEKIGINQQKKSVPTELLKNQPEGAPMTWLIFQKLRETALTSFSENFEQASKKRTFKERRGTIKDDFDTLGEAAQQEEGLQKLNLAVMREADERRSLENIQIDLRHTPTARGHMLWPGKDFSNSTLSDFKNLQFPYSGGLSQLEATCDISMVADIDRKSTPRMPWHDVSVLVLGRAARDVARHFIERWNHCKVHAQARYKNRRVTREYPMLVPKSVVHFRVEDHGKKIRFKPFLLPINVQVVRSVSEWSAGVNVTESSIHKAYIESIAEAEYFIYIENQFFVSPSPLNKVTRNEISDAIFNRVVRAAKELKTFRVFIIIPLLPAFPGGKGENVLGTAARMITDWNAHSLSKGKHSLLQRLTDVGIQWEKYIGVFSLRTHGRLLNGDLATELIYVHSKLMIVDDKRVICGSANINDRSMLGSRDSEIAFVIDDKHKENEIASKMNGEPVIVGLFASSWRKQLFAEHLGQLKPSKWNLDDRFVHSRPLANSIPLDDPISHEFWYAFKNIARRNTKIYAERLTDVGIQWEKYIGVFSLRTHGRLLNGDLATELIYVHSKLMIVDDKRVICGSANINDRSMLGSRDSEIAFVIDDKHKENEIASKMNGEPVIVGLFASSWRKQLFAEHLGQLKPSKWNLDDRFVHSRPLANSIPLDDPISHEFWYAFKNIARRNTKIYAEVFNCIPSDSIRKHQQAKLIVASEALFTCNPAEAENRLAQVRGHLVEYPLHFLEDENLSMTVGTKEFFLPASFWT